MGLSAPLGGRISLLGREVRYVGLLYAKRALIFLAVELAIILALDVASNMSILTTTAAGAAPTSETPRLAYYVLLRACYVMPSLLPIAAFGAVMWAEYGLTVSRERQMIAGSGRSPLKSLLPAVMFGLALGLMQFGAAAYLKPLSVEMQAKQGMRFFGGKFVGNNTTNPVWLAVDGTILNARIRFADGVELSDVRLFSFDGNTRVDRIAVAETAVSGPGANVWTLSAGSLLDLGDLRGEGRMPVGLRSVPFDTLELALPLSPLWVENYDVQPMLLDQAALGALVDALADAPDGYRYQAALAERYSTIFYCLGMALLAATLSLMRFFNGMNVLRILGVAAYGGAGYVAFNAASTLSVFGKLPPIIGPWLVPAAMILFCVLWAAGRDWRVRVALDAPIPEGSA